MILIPMEQFLNTQSVTALLDMVASGLAEMMSELTQAGSLGFRRTKQSLIVDRRFERKTKQGI